MLEVIVPREVSRDFNRASDCLIRSGGGQPVPDFGDQMHVLVWLLEQPARRVV